MLKSRTLKILLLILVGYGLLLLPAAIWPTYLDSPARMLLLVPLLLVYMFHGAGVPGLLEDDGLCGWGWCSPTFFGWMFAAALWIGIAWLIAWSIASLTNRLAAR